MKILLVGQSWFKKEFEEEGHQVLSIGFPSHLDVLPRYPSINVKLAISEAGLDFVPDVIVIWDNSSPIVLSGLEDYEVPILFYSIDTHHHSHLHQYISVFADETWVAQKDYLNCFADVGRKVEWIPLWASHDVTPKLEKKYGAVFVGTLNKKLNPERVNFFEELSKRSPILVTGGNWNEIFSEAEIVVNQTVKRSEER
ncbi:MAG: hypothetical protein KDD56_09900, partial [Bdellovibrionales bacterium]|nr:hypothetical protein [Bdellovibrionales bacterium]